MPVAGAPHPLAQAPLAGQTMIIAHRGYRACYPENTLCAFNASLGRCAMIELDVQLSRDGIPVVFHDYTLERTSNATSIGPSSRPPSLALGGWALAELLQLDIGSWFLRDDPFGTIRSQLISKTALQPLMPQRIMTLEQIPERFIEWAQGSIDSQVGILALMNLLMLFAGMFIDLPAAILLLGPLFVPLATAYHIDLIQLGVMMVVNLAIGLYSPPVGTTLFIGSMLAKASIGKTVKELLPFYGVGLIVLGLMTYVPAMTLRF